MLNRAQDDDTRTRLLFDVLYCSTRLGLEDVTSAVIAELDKLPEPEMSRIFVDLIQAISHIAFGKSQEALALLDANLSSQFMEREDFRIWRFVQTLPTGMEAQAAGKFLPATRISPSIYHVGFLVGNSQRSIDFHNKILGFQETWRGGRDPNELSWINMRVPDGTDYIELMLYRKLPETYGTSNHIAIKVPDANGAVTALDARPAFKNY